MSDSIGGDARAVESVIHGQIAALRAGDVPRAYSYASKRIKAQFPLADFEAMVRKGYGFLGESAEEEVEEIRVTGDEATARVIVTGGDGRRTTARYELAREDGAWRVTGVLLGPTPATPSMNGRGPH